MSKIISKTISKTISKSISKKNTTSVNDSKEKIEFQIKPSVEQSLIIDSIKYGNNISISSCPGSGKTTTILLIAQNFPDKKILQVTYNSQLKCEVREKAKKLDLNNLEIHSYHSLAVKYYDRYAHTDQVIDHIIGNNKPINSDVNKFDIIVIDECQDTVHLYFSLICKFIDNVYGVIERPQIVFLGDKNQCIYKFKGADHRFLTLSHRIWDFEVINMELTTSYRLTHQIAEFINTNVIGHRRIKTVKDGPRVEYISANPFTIHKYLSKRIVEEKYKPDDIFILCPSVKGGTPCRKLENELVRLGFPCYVPIDDNSKIDDSIIEGKVVFTTFHQCKGRERPLVIIYGFDSSYFTYYCRDSPKNICPETLYVAMSRASHRLMLVADEKSIPCQFLKNINTSWHLSTTGKIQDGSSINLPNIRSGENHTTSVTDLVKFIKDQYLQEFSFQINELFEQEYAPTTNPTIPSKIKSETGTGNGTDQYEEISDLNGIAMPCILQGRREKGKGGQDLYDFILSKKTTPLVKEAMVKLKWPCKTISDYIYLANVYQASRSGMNFKLAQITNYNWLTEDMIDVCISNMEKHILKVKHFEMPLGNNSDKTGPIYEFDSEYGLITIRGVIDAFEQDKNGCVIWEFKCVDSLSLENFLQTAIYQWIWNQTRPELPSIAKLFNIRTGEIFTMKREKFELLDTLITALVKNKYEKAEDLEDDAFIDKCCTVSCKKSYLRVETGGDEDDENGFVLTGGCVF